MSNIILSSLLDRSYDHIHNVEFISSSNLIYVECAFIMSIVVLKIVKSLFYHPAAVL
jgi:hypothetical protein